VPPLTFLPGLARGEPLTSLWYKLSLAVAAVAPAGAA